MTRARPDPERLRARLIDVEIAHGYRIVDARHAATPLGCVPAPSRFGDPAGRFAVLYAALSVTCALWEALLRDDFLGGGRVELPVGAIRSRVLVTLGTRVPLRLVDLRGDGTTRLRVPTAVTRDRRHRAGRAFAAALHAHVPEADGVLYDGRFTSDGCVAVFDRALDRLRTHLVVGLARSPEVHDALADHDIVLVDGGAPEDGSKA